MTEDLNESSIGDRGEEIESVDADNVGDGGRGALEMAKREAIESDIIRCI